ncbi:unnamed protein product [Blepharisma stoltei]|uniref:RING-type domain-containing protein n=1 Tax=Blepharisma stoltei TaxID=1481888 RepID=A0AAU9J6K8_9CILI|nr:unnamed protein product [Blepharisma stoltei]
MKLIFKHPLFFFVIILAALIVLSSALFISFASILTPEWNSFSYKEETFNYGIFDCIDCPVGFEHTNPNCVYSLSCSQDSSSDLCSTGKKLIQARSSVISCETVAGVLTILLIERYIYMLMRRGYGKVWIFYTLIGLITGSKLAGFLSYIELTNSKISSSCDTNDEICNNNGPYYMLTSLILSAIGCGLGAVVLRFRNKKLDKEKIIEGLESSAMISGKVLPVLLIGAAFTGLALGWDWISFQAPKTSTGTLLSMNSYYKYGDFIKNLDFDCISGPACANKSGLALSQRECNAFDKVNNAGRVYYWMVSFSLLFLLLWIENLINVLRKKEFGISESNYVWPALCVILNLIGIISWFNISGVTYGANCRVKAGDNDISFCSEEGPTFAIISLICEFFAAMFYCLLYAQKSSTTTHQIFPGQKTLSKSKLGKIILEYPQFDDCNVTKDQDSSFDKDLMRSPSIMYRPNTRDTVDSDYLYKRKDTQDSEIYKAKETLAEICLTCESQLDQISIVTGNCGHNIHIKCHGRCDGEKLCEDCLKSLE